MVVVVVVVVVVVACAWLVPITIQLFGARLRKWAGPVKTLL